MSLTRTTIRAVESVEFTDFAGTPFAKLRVLRVADQVPGHIYRNAGGAQIPVVEILPLAADVGVVVTAAIGMSDSHNDLEVGGVVRIFPFV